MNIKECKVCEKVLAITEFYKGGSRGNAIYGRCKKCHNKTRKNFKVTYNYKKRPTGFDKLDEKTKEDIKYMIAVGKSKKSISDKYNISYPTFLYWCRNNKIPKYDKEIKLD